MRAVIVHSFGEPALVTEVPAPMPRRGQVRIQVTAAALNPVDAATQEGLMSQARPGILSPREHIGLGWDVAGVVDQVADGVAAFAPGDAVIGLRDRLDTGVGTFAEQVVLDTGDLAAAPSGVDPVAASTIPLNGLTALQALDALASSGLHAGRSILVTGAAGGLGGFGVELAAMRGLRVIGAAGAADEELVRKLGASHFIPRSAASLAADVRDLVPGGVDAVFDAAALGFPAMDTVRGGGIYVNFVPVDPIPVRGIRVLPVHIRADGAALAGLSSLAGAGRLTLRVAGTYPLEQAAEAFARLAKGGLRGRLVLVP